MTQTISCWNARLWRHLTSAEPLSGNAPTFFGHLVVDDERVRPEGSYIIGGIVLEIHDSSLSIPATSQALAMACEGRLLREIIEIPPCGMEAVDTGADQALVSSASHDRKKNSLRLTYVSRRVPWSDIIKENTP